ncbi:MAG: hypothetical protein ABI811_22945 [Acidobacteriota bacterium]
MKPRFFSLGEVAAAVGIPRPTLFAWAQKGYLPFLDEGRAAGEDRRFDQDEVAYTAALSFVAERTGGVSAALGIMEKARYGGGMWNKALEIAKSAQLLDDEGCLLVRQHVWKGVSEVDVRWNFYHGELGSQVTLLMEEPVEGAFVNEAGEEVSSQPDPLCSVTVYPICKAISRAFGLLPG